MRTRHPGQHRRTTHTQLPLVTPQQFPHQPSLHITQASTVDTSSPTASCQPTCITSPTPGLTNTQPGCSHASPATCHNLLRPACTILPTFSNTPRLPLTECQPPNSSFPMSIAVPRLSLLRTNNHDQPQLQHANDLLTRFLPGTACSTPSRGYKMP